MTRPAQLGARGRVADPPPRAASRGLLRTALRGFGQTLITLGVVLLLFCVYELSVTGLFAARDQRQLSRDLRGAWAAPAPAPPAPAIPPRVAPDQPPAPPQYEGSPFARLYLPRLSGLHPLVVVEGVEIADLDKGGPGHLPGSALPGQLGNMVFSGHRTTYGAPFGGIGELVPGDALIVETRDAWFTYRVTGSRVVAPTAIGVALPVPGKPGASPTERLLTLTTCNPKYSARQRLIVFSTLDSALDKAGGARPDALRQT